MKDRLFHIVSSALVLALPVTALAQRKDYTITVNSFPETYTPTYVGNGNIGLTSSRLGTDPARSYMAWIYEHYPGDVARIASLPAWNTLDYSDGDKWLNDAAKDGNGLTSYTQTLDMYDGTLRTSYDWRDGAKSTALGITDFVSRSNPDLGVVKLVLTPHFAGRVRILFSVTPWPEPDRMNLAEISDIEVKMKKGLPDVWYPGHMNIVSHTVILSGNDAICRIVSEPDGNPVRVAAATVVSWSSDVSKPNLTADTSDGNTSVNLEFDARPGNSYTFYKYAGIVSSHGSSDAAGSAERAASTAMHAGYAAVLARSESKWHDLWKTDVILKGNPELQKVIRSSMFYLLCSARAGSGFGIPPMGLSSDGYYGHIFWDSDTWMFPPLLIMHPDIARSMVMFRYKALPAAEENANLNHYRGAMYPWESDENGNEACPKFAYQNALYENHVTGDVAFAQWQYYLATKDKGWLRKFGYPVIRATADFWSSRATYDSTSKRYNINKVVSVDEGLIGVNNDAYTNLVARRNLEIATEAAKLLQEKPDPQWREVAERLYIPYDSSAHCYLTYENAPPQSLGAVVPLLYYPLELSVPDNVKKNDLENALAFTKKNGSGVMMGITLYQNVAAEIKDRELFDEFFNMSFRPYLRGPFNVLAETPDNMSTNFLTGAGGFLQQVIFGYTGLRITEKGLVPVYSPMLPEGVTQMKVTNIHFRGKTYDIIVKNGKTALERR